MNHSQGRRYWGDLEGETPPNPLLGKLVKQGKISENNESLHFSLCKSERTFNRLKLLKKYLRSTMTEERLDNLIILFCERDIADKLSKQKVLQ